MALNTSEKLFVAAALALGGGVATMSDLAKENLPDRKAIQTTLLLGSIFSAAAANIVPLVSEWKKGTLPAVPLDEEI